MKKNYYVDYSIPDCESKFTAWFDNEEEAKKLYKESDYCDEPGSVMAEDEMDEMNYESLCEQRKHLRKPIKNMVLLLNSHRNMVGQPPN